jgi:hypothetical protein
MNRQLMEVVLPRLAKRLFEQLKRYRSGQLNDAQFTKGFESLLRQQHAWLARQGVPEARAALAIHSAVLILSGPGLRAEAVEGGVPLEVIECKAIREAAADLAKNYQIPERQAFRAISRLVARYGD